MARSGGKKTARALALALLVGAGLALGAGCDGARAATARLSSAEPVLLKADQVSYDRTRNLVMAQGHVELDQGKRILLADSIVYDQSTGKVTARGHVRLLEENGNVLFAQYVELTDRMRDGFVRDARILFPDNSRAAAYSAVRTNGVKTVFSHAVYTACDVCALHPDEPPLWQIKAESIVHNEDTHEITFHNAFFDVFGVPVLYTPYLREPDPTVKRKTGFLVPSFSSDSQLGFVTRLPFYIPINPSLDLTLTPIITSSDGEVLNAEIRQRTANGQYDIDGSLARTNRVDSNGNALSGQQWRGHVQGYGRFNLSDQWRTGFDIFRASDPTYLKQFRFSNVDTLTSRAFLEGESGRNYAAVNAYAFQGLLAGDSAGVLPYVLPALDYAYAGVPGRDGYFSFDANALSIYRTQGLDTRRLSTTAAWTLPFVTAGGSVFRVKAALRSDVYSVTAGNYSTGAGIVDFPYSGLAHRVDPSATVHWRYPLIREAGGMTEMIEPILMVTTMPNGGNPANLPNEDSQNFQFNDLNLFSSDPYPGLDRVPGGTRAAYGLHAAVFNSGGAYADALFGQSAETSPGAFPRGSGLDKKLSDYVGRVMFEPSALFEITDRFRLNSRELGVNANELYLNFGPPYQKFGVYYTNLSSQAAISEYGVRRQIGISSMSQITRRWQLVADWEHAFGSSDNTLTTNVQLRYNDECLHLSLIYSRSNILFRNLPPSTSFTVRVKLAHFG